MISVSKLVVCTAISKNLEVSQDMNANIEVIKRVESVLITYIIIDDVS